jgi:hypothetical protein
MRNRYIITEENNTVTDITSEPLQTFETSAETTSVTEIPLHSSTSDSQKSIYEEYIHNESEISDSENNDVNEGNSAVVNDDSSIDLPVIQIR